MKRALLAVCALLLAAPLAFARGGGGRGFSGARASSGFHAPSRAFSGARSSSGFRAVSRASSGGFARPTAFARSSSFFRPAARPAFSHSSGRTTFHAAAGRTTRRATASDSTPPAWATIGAKIVSEGQPPVYSQAAGGGTHSVEGGGFVAMDQSSAHDVGRSPGVTWAAPDRAPSSGASGGGGTGASSNGPAFDPSF